MNKKIVNEILEEYSQKRERAIEASNHKIAEIYMHYPELQIFDEEISSAGLKLMKASLDTTEDYGTALERIKKETNAVKEKRKAYLLKNGISDNYLEPQYECGKCKDTGFVENRMCECLRKEVAERSYRSSGLGAALENQTFDNLNLFYYKKGNTAEAYNYMVNLFHDAKAYAENFNGKGNILMIGGTGLGKTHISSSIAKEVIKKGYTVVYESAQKIFDTYEEKKFGRNPDADTERFEYADLLIIDDLGTENVTQLTVSVLYNLINQRCNNCKATIINTNLSPEELKTVYKPRIFSRLFGDFKLMHFKGMDIRLQKLEE